MPVQYEEICKKNLTTVSVCKERQNVTVDGSEKNVGLLLSRVKEVYDLLRDDSKRCVFTQEKSALLVLEHSSSMMVSMQ